MKLDRLSVEAVFVLESGEAGFGGEVEEDDEVGAEVLGGEEVEGTEGFDIESAGVALIDDRGVGVAVAEDDLALFESGADGPADVFGAVGEEEEELGLGAHVAAFEQEFADCVAEFAGAGFSGLDDGFSYVLESDG